MVQSKRFGCGQLAFQPLALQLPGWEDKGVGGVGSDAEAAAQQLSVDLEAFDSVDELTTLGGAAVGRRVLQVWLE